MEIDGTKPDLENTADARRLRRVAKAISIVKAIDPRRDEPKAAPLRHTELPGSRPDPAGFVYFVYCAGRIKIGYATDVAARMFGIATSSPFPIRLLLTIRGDLEDEQNYHKRFASDRANLEWFDLSDDLRAFLEDNFEWYTFPLLLEVDLEAKDYFVERTARFMDEIYEPSLDEPS